MFYHLFNKAFRLAFVLLILFGLFLFWIDDFSEWIITLYTGIEFSYEAPAHLKLIYLLLGVVLIGLTSAVNNNEHFESQEIKRNYEKWVITMIIFFLVGELIHVWMISDVLLNRESIVELEQNFWVYYLADFLLVFGFSLGGFLFVKPLIHQN